MNENNKTVIFIATAAISVALAYFSIPRKLTLLVKVVVWGRLFLILLTQDKLQVLK